MIRRACLVALGLTLALLSACDGGAGTLTGKVIKTIKVDGKPTAIAITPDGITAYIADGQTTGMVTPVNLATRAVGTPITMRTGADAIAITPDGRTAYVTNPRITRAR